MEPKSTAELELIKDGRIAWLIFNRPQVRNAMTWGMYDTLERHCHALSEDPEVDVVVLRGSGGEAFVAGTDIKQFTGFETAQHALDYEHRIDAVVGALESLGKPTIALLEGFCVGGGAAIAMACDFRYCTPDLRFGVPIAKTLGNCVSIANVSRLVDLVGAARAKEVLMLAKLFGADEAKQAGLVTEVVAAEEIEAEVRKVAERLGGFAPLTLRASKEEISRVLAARRPPAGSEEDLIALCYTSRDFKSAVKAFVDKTPHAWRGE
ncbi:MAG: enoyl-CoA hydratase/isomerase family protein [Halomonas sp.]|jgi:enoyl-CoA hydratase|uniref:Enoyl-CoA hydratase n=1 Tax=Billgrantia tianxiuensis TaxID=2497861 RepID=A0A6I6SR68_9GAMM|nr:MULTISPECIES: enoyl-CoA hydratase/isomerase family protein [Halomonas]MCE8033569.1 enoyl-CoA hydratase [Halomonas sp. MCCC 1A11057]MDX5431987.1 enoyl-CoA hydratase/isomerase family protein [Halomonas sp.]QHC51166.1 enoyl-CoA hydratase [Halomonas tianxiuensis]